MAKTLFDELAPRYMARLIADFDMDIDDAAAIMGNAGHESAGFKLMQEVKPRGGRGGRRAGQRPLEGPAEWLSVIPPKPGFGR